MFWAITVIIATIGVFYFNLGFGESLGRSSLSGYSKGGMYGVFAGWVVALLVLLLWWRNAPTALIVILVVLVFCLPYYLAFTQRGKRWRSLEPT